MNVKSDKLTRSTNSLVILSVFGFKKISSICNILIYVISSTPPSIAVLLPSFSIVKIVTIAFYSYDCLITLHLIS
jgi:hypothetical protein